MCGIAGIINLDGQKPANELLVRAMCARIVHRGPDEDGFFCDRNVGLGMRRLQIIDVAGGRQPISNEDGTITTVFNGEIYNYVELRAELIQHGHTFRTNSDTEVLVHSYEQWGDGFVSRLRGMFAIALWDAPRRRLLIIRDRLGIKPLYYAQDSGRLLFASEIKAILPALEGALSLDHCAKEAYFAFNYIPEPLTIYREISKLPAGHMLIVEDQSVRVMRYWDLAELPEPEPIDEGEAAEQTMYLLRESVRLRLRCDVPFGAFLSGGVDSSLVVAMMSEMLPAPVKTFTIGFAEASTDESEDARATAEHFGTDHHNVICGPDQVEMLHGLMGHFDEPFGDASAIPTYLVSKLAAGHVKMVLSGDGGDELFAGYEHYDRLVRLERLRRVPRPLLNGGLRAGAMLLRGLRPRLAARLSWVAYRLSLPALENALEGVAVNSASNRARLIPDGYQDQRWRHGFETAFQRFDTDDPIKQMSYTDIKTYLAEDILTKVDRMSMANSLEARVPLLDHELVEFVFGLPSAMKINGVQRKYLLKKISRRILPEQITKRPKRGFGIPLDEWFCGGLKERAADTFNSRTIRESGLFDLDTIERWRREHAGGERRHGERLWTVLAFCSWLDTHEVGI